MTPSTMTEIAQLLSVSRTSVYRHFEGVLGAVKVDYGTAGFA